VQPQTVSVTKPSISSGTARKFGPSLIDLALLPCPWLFPTARLPFCLPPALGWPGLVVPRPLCMLGCTAQTCGGCAAQPPFVIADKETSPREFTIDVWRDFSPSEKLVRLSELDPTDNDRAKHQERANWIWMWRKTVPTTSPSDRLKMQSMVIEFPPSLLHQLMSLAGFGTIAQASGEAASPFFGGGARSSAWGAA